VEHEAIRSISSFHRGTPAGRSINVRWAGARPPSPRVEVGPTAGTTGMRQIVLLRKPKTHLRSIAN
jgi:hypothetical protein